MTMGMGEMGGLGIAGATVGMGLVVEQHPTLLEENSVKKLLLVLLVVGARALKAAINNAAPGGGLKITKKYTNETETRLVGAGEQGANSIQTMTPET